MNILQRIFWAARFAAEYIDPQHLSLLPQYPSINPVINPLISHLADADLLNTR